jgi:hypothetical protein
MLRQAKWLFYRDRVLEQLGALLLAYPRGRQFFGDFPGLKAKMREHFDAGLAPASASLQLASGILTGLLRQLGAAERALVLARLRSVELEALKAIAAERNAGRRRDETAPAAFAAELAGVAIFMARGLAEEGMLGRAEYAWLLGELETALGSNGEAGSGPLSRRFALPEERPLWGFSDHP